MNVHVHFFKHARSSHFVSTIAKQTIPVSGMLEQITARDHGPLSDCILHVFQSHSK